MVCQTTRFGAVSNLALVIELLSLFLGLERQQKREVSGPQKERVL